MATGKSPFCDCLNLKVLFQKLDKSDFLIPSNLSPDLSDLIKQLLVADPEKRLGANSIKEVKTHSFFKNVDWDEMLMSDRKGMLVSKFDKEEVMMNALNLIVPERHPDGYSQINLQGFDYNEENDIAK